jgi:hypothetical protein
LSSPNIYVIATARGDERSIPRNRYSSDWILKSKEAVKLAGFWQFPYHGSIVFGSNSEHISPASNRSADKR